MWVRCSQMPFWTTGQFCREILTHPRPHSSDPEHQVQAWCYWSGGGFVSEQGEHTRESVWVPTQAPIWLWSTSSVPSVSVTDSLQGSIDKWPEKCNAMVSNSFLTLFCFCTSQQNSSSPTTLVPYGNSIAIVRGTHFKNKDRIAVCLRC